MMRLSSILTFARYPTPNSSLFKHFIFSIGKYHLIVECFVYSWLKYLGIHFVYFSFSFESPVIIKVEIFVVLVRSLSMCLISLCMLLFYDLLPVRRSGRRSFIRWDNLRVRGFSIPSHVARLMLPWSLTPLSRITIEPRAGVSQHSSPHLLRNLRDIWRLSEDVLYKLKRPLNPLRKWQYTLSFPHISHLE